jgi:hypothetical protein
MARISLIAAALLIALGVGGYVVSDSDKPATALIPAFAGLLIGLAGAAALKEAWRMHAMHAVAGLALLGVLAPAGRMASAGLPDSSLAAGSQIGMLVICAGLLALCVKSFIDARKARENENQAG